MSTGYLYCDGGARGNPGPAAAAAVLFDAAQRVVDQASKYLGSTTNNIAEYEGLLLGLALAQAQGVQELKIKLDSELVVKQINGEYKVRHPGLKTLYKKAKSRLQSFRRWELAYVPREENTLADSLVNMAIDRGLETGWSGHKSDLQT
jgi:ribonuclease HI